MKIEGTDRETGNAASSTTDGVRIIAFDTAIGAEIQGICVADGVTAQQYAAVRNALDRHGVVVLRGQDVSPANQRAFAAGIGTLRELVTSK